MKLQKKFSFFFVKILNFGQRLIFTFPDEKVNKNNREKRYGSIHVKCSINSKNIVENIIELDDEKV